VAFLDLKAAFDRVWLPGLLYKLSHMGIRGKAWSWIRAFLHDRRVRVVTGLMHSEWFSLSAGVPQGAVLSPFLFLVYINDLVDCASEAGCYVSLYADDVAAWSHDPTSDAHGDACLQDFLRRASAWATKWKVLFGQS